MAEARSRARQLPQPHSHATVISPVRDVAKCRPTHADDVARSPLADLGMLLQHLFGPLPPHSGPQGFFASTSCKICLSSVKSATTCFNRRFSSSSCFTFRSSE